MIEKKGFFMNLKNDEIKWIEEHPERCQTCGHLAIFHNEHCCVFCLIPGCKCKNLETIEEEENEDGYNKNIEKRNQTDEKESQGS